MNISVVIPVYNEVETIGEVLARVQRTALVDEIIVVDDASTDGTRERLEKLVQYHDSVKVRYHARNLGKGAALRTGFAAVSGDIVIIQDADLEYDPCDYPQLLAPLLDNRADVVFGSRFLCGPHRVLFFLHYVGNKVLTLFANILTNLNLSDMETGAKAFNAAVLQDLTLRSNRFGFEPEFTVKVAKKMLRIYEVPVSYNGRTYAEGKKITWKDGVLALFTLLWYRFFD